MTIHLPAKAFAPQIDMELQLRGELAAKLLAEAKRRRCEPVELMSNIIETVIEDDLFKAVLDE